MSDFGIALIDPGILSHPDFPDEPFTFREAWLWMIVTAAKAPKRRRVGTAVVALERGQLAYSHRFLAKRWRWSVAKVQRFLARLETMCDAGGRPKPKIAVSDEQGVTRITLLSYDKYPHSVAELTVAGSKAAEFPVTGSKVAEFAVAESHPESPVNAVSDCGGLHSSTGPPPSESLSESGPSQIRETLPTESLPQSGSAESARAREHKYITQQAFDLADEVMLMFDIDPKFPLPSWHGLPMFLQAGLSSGWRRELVLIAAAKVRARKKQFYSFKYLQQPIVREHEEAAQAALPLSSVPVVAAENPENAHAVHRQGRRASAGPSLATLGAQLRRRPAG